MTLWSAHAVRVGAGVPTLLDAGVVILFGEPVPGALSDLSVVHERGGRAASAPLEPLSPGDELQIGDQTFVVDEVGEAATDNLAELGHAVIYLNSPQQRLLSGAVKVSGPDLTIPVVGDTIVVRRGRPELRDED